MITVKVRFHILHMTDRFSELQYIRSCSYSKCVHVFYEPHNNYATLFLAHFTHPYPSVKSRNKSEIPLSLAIKGLRLLVRFRQ